MKKLLRIILSIVIATVICILSYQIGNYVMDTFNDENMWKFMSSTIGFFILVAFGFICYGVHLIIND